MKKLSLILCLLIISVWMFGCERNPQIVSFQNATMAGSSQHTIKILFSKDDKYNDKCYDLFIQSDKQDITLVTHFENMPSFKLKIEEKDNWYSLSNLYYSAKKMAGSEDFIGVKDATNLTIIFESLTPCKITLQAVVGDKIENAEKTGYLLANTQIVSKEFSVDIK